MKKGKRKLPEPQPANNPATHPNENQPTPFRPLPYDFRKAILPRSIDLILALKYRR